MNEIEAVRELWLRGILLRDQVESFRCGSEHDPDHARKVLELAEIARPGTIQEPRKLD